MKVLETKANWPKLCVSSVRRVANGYDCNLIETGLNQEGVPGNDADDKDDTGDAHHSATPDLLRRRDLLHDPRDQWQRDQEKYEDVNDED